MPEIGFEASSTDEEPVAHGGSAAREVVDLRDLDALDAELTGSKAAALARAAAAGLDVLPGVVLTTEFSRQIDAGASLSDHAALVQVFARVNGEGRSLVARSSSVLEDTGASSMAGQFESVVGIRTYSEFVEAVRRVLDSRSRRDAAGTPIAVLVQPLIMPRYGGVLFGVDPVSGRTDRRVVSAVDGAPERLVSGEVNGSRYVLDEKADVVAFSLADGPELPQAHLRQLVALSDTVAHIFGGPQDVEWAIEADGRVMLLQSRPVTTEISGVPVGPIYGPGPVAETFPSPLTELEQDLWVPPLRDAVREAVLLAGTVTRRDLKTTAVVVTVAGHVAIDLRLAGVVTKKRGLLELLNPVAAVRRLGSAWRIGRLRAAIPELAERLVDRVDAELATVPALADLTNRQLIALLHRGYMALRALHGHEILMGLLVGSGTNRMTGASVALRVLAEARQEGLTDQQIVERSPVVLALTAPRIAPRPQLPERSFAAHVETAASPDSDNGILREALRLRVRWIQELTGRAAWELGVRLSETGDLVEPDMIRHMSLDHLDAVFTKRAVVVPALVQTHLHDFGAPLPVSFRLSDRGKVIPEQSDEVGGGRGAGGGSGRGRVTGNTHDPPPGSVLVTTKLTPDLATLLPRLNGVVVETGSVLSHFAILAREAGVAMVVGYANATTSLPEGADVIVDGGTGRVTLLDEEVHQ